MRRVFLAVLLVLAVNAAPTDNESDASRPWLNRQLPVTHQAAECRRVLSVVCAQIEQRVDQLLARMNREEKIAMTWATHTSSDIVSQVLLTLQCC